MPPDWRFGTGGHGAYAWAELNTRSGAASDQFFGELCHYAITQIGDGHRLDYAVWSVEGTEVIGRQKMGREFPYGERSHWMVYFNAAPEIGTDYRGVPGHRARRPGDRRALRRPFGRITVVEDHAGMAFSVIDQSRTVEAGPRSEVDEPYDD